ncbi:hypothetical protein [Methylobacterium sp. WL116]|nr:hypothetical protein [Methylobacterium sp. WL116]
MLKIVGAILTVAAVVAIGGLVQLSARAVRAVRGLVGRTPAVAQITAP